MATRLEKSKRKADLKKRRKARLAADPAIQVTQTRFREPSTPSRYQEHGKYKKSSNGIITISDKAMHRLGMY